MADDTARALGAGSGEPITIAGKQCKMKPLGAVALTEIERDCLDRYRRSYLKTYVDNMDLLGVHGEGLLLKKMDEAARWDVADLPKKYAYDSKGVIVTPELAAWIEENRGSIPTMEDDDDKSGNFKEMIVQRLATTYLDDGSLTEEKYKELTKADPPMKFKIGYANWWITADIEGMLTMVWKCFEDSGVTRKEVENELRDNPNLLSTITREIENLSVPAQGNG